MARYGFGHIACVLASSWVLPLMAMQHAPTVGEDMGDARTSRASLMLHSPPDTPCLLMPPDAPAQIGDTGALVLGRALGGAPMAPAMSPAKTWEGNKGRGQGIEGRENGPV